MSLGRGGGEIPKGGRAGRARFPGIWPGGRDHGGGEIPGTPVSTSANLVARTGTVACFSIEKKQSDWCSLTLVAKKLNLIQLPELTARSPVNARFQLGFRAASLSIALCKSRFK